MQPNNQQHPNPNDQIKNQQQQLKNTEIISQQQYIKYTVRQDFLNLIGIAVDYKTALEEINKGQGDELMKVQQNRLILQVNLSNTIHSDLSYQFRNQPALKILLEEEKQKVKNHLNSIKEQFNNDDIKQLLNIYSQNNLVENPTLQQQKLNEIQHQSQFNQKTVKKVFDPINTTDQIYKDLENGKLEAEELTLEKINKYIEKRKQDAKSKIHDADCNCSCQLI